MPKEKVLIITILDNQDREYEELIMAFHSYMPFNDFIENGICLKSIETPFEISLEREAKILYEKNGKTVKKSPKISDESNKSKIQTWFKDHGPQIAKFAKGRKWWHWYIIIAAGIIGISLIRSLILNIFF